jgi:hypothetical protein
MSSDGKQTEEQQTLKMLHDFCEVLGGENLRRLPDGRWTFTVRHTVTVEDVRSSGLWRRSAFADLFEAES